MPRNESTHTLMTLMNCSIRHEASVNCYYLSLPICWLLNSPSAASKPLRLHTRNLQNPTMPPIDIQSRVLGEITPASKDLKHMRCWLGARVSGRDNALHYLSGMEHDGSNQVVSNRTHPFTVYGYVSPVSIRGNLCVGDFRYLPCLPCNLPDIACHPDKTNFRHISSLVWMRPWYTSQTLDFAKISKRTARSIQAQSMLVLSYIKVW
jgi:hypothetical protein